jgi:hypothetical protein
MKLYARFTSIILADRDFAKELNETAKDNEFIKKKETGDNGSDGQSLKSLDQKSVGSSQTSDRSKEAILMKKKREIMEERLDSPINGFLRNANIFTIFFFLLMAASASLSYTQIFKTNDGNFFNLNLLLW